MNKILNSSEIITHTKDILNITHDSELAKYLEVDKQSVYQYKSKTQVDIQQKIICELILYIKEMECNKE